MQNRTTKCYSYSRWSSAKQGNGTTLERQLDMAKEIADKHKLELVENYKDDGVSAFKGKNSKSGDLAAFINKVKSGEIEQGSWLVVENLDRISREDILKAQRLFMELLELGITIVTGMDGKIYSGCVFR